MPGMNLVDWVKSSSIFSMAEKFDNNLMHVLCDNDIFAKQFHKWLRASLDIFRNILR